MLFNGRWESRNGGKEGRAGEVLCAGLSHDVIRRLVGGRVPWPGMNTLWRWDTLERGRGIMGGLDRSVGVVGGVCGCSGWDGRGVQDR